MAITFTDCIFHLRQGEWSNWNRHGACAVQECFDCIFGSFVIGGRRYAVYGSEVSGEGFGFFFVRYAPNAIVLLKRGDMRYWSLKLLGGFPNRVVFFRETRDIYVSNVAFRMSCRAVLSCLVSRLYSLLSRGL